MKISQKQKHFLLLALIVSAAINLTGCAHDVTFQDVHYDIATEKYPNASVTAVIDDDTLTQKISVRSFMTGIANDWEVEPGDMLKQVADIELPQMFSHYVFATSYTEPTQGIQRLVLQFTIPSYRFDDFHASVKVHVVAYAPGHRVLLEKTYAAEGDTHGAKMFWAGAFGMKSAIRQSSLDAFQQIFKAMRGDLGEALKEQKTNDSSNH